VILFLLSIIPLFLAVPLYFVIVYRPPKKCSAFISEFSELLSIIHSKYNKIIIVGDFNIHVDNPSDSLSSEFLNLINFMNFNQHVSSSTHNRGHILDLLINFGLSATVSSVVDVGLSDHHCVFF